MEYINNILDNAIISFHADLKYTEVNPNDEESVLSDMTCMTKFENNLDTPTPLSTPTLSLTLMGLGLTPAQIEILTPILQTPTKIAHIVPL